MRVLYESFEMVTLTEPYIPGFLAFREVGFLLRMLEKLRADKPELVPQLILIDGNGILHPRGVSLGASHARRKATDIRLDPVSLLFRCVALLCS